MKTILYICELPAYHISNEITLLKEYGYEVIVLNVFKSSFEKIENYHNDIKLYNMHNNLKWYPAIKFIELLYRNEINYNLIDEIVNKYDIDILYSSWSSAVILDGYFIKNRYPQLKWIHRYLMYPASLNKYKVRFENYIIKKYTKYIDHIIFHTEEMMEYFINTIDYNIEKQTVLFEKFNKTYFLNKNQYSETTSERFSLVFLGTIIPNTENDVIETLLSLPKEIDIYIHLKEEYKSLVKQNNIIFFDKKNIGIELTDYIQRFDGILALYNYNHIEMERINLVIPNRITLGLPALKRFFIPNNQLKSSQNLLKKYDLLCEFKDNDELLEKLEFNRKNPIKNKDNLKEKMLLGKEFVEIFEKEVKR